MASEHHRESSDGTLSIADLHAVLGCENRRRVLRFFRERDEHVATVDELADHLATPNGGFEDPGRAKVSLHHAVLPKLADTEVLDYGPRSNVIEYRGHERLEALLSSATVD